MVTTVVPFRAGGKTRLPEPLRAELALAMLGDVLEAAAAVGEVRLVTADAGASALAGELGASVVPDPGGGQGAAVLAGLAGLGGPALVVNADLPCATASALRALIGLAPAVVPALDGTTNALALVAPATFLPRYGPGSATRFADDGFALASVPELVHDVDTVGDLAGIVLPLGHRSAAAGRRHRAVREPAA